MDLGMEDVYQQWNDAGCPHDGNLSVPHDIKMYYVWRTLTMFGYRSFVESGTCQGDATAAMLPYVDEVYTIEAYGPLYSHSAQRFNGDPRVHLYFGDSAVLLPEILKDLQPSVFWLDAHYSGDGTIQLDKDTPIVAELKAIACSTSVNFHAIVIDDARGFGEWKDYPTEDELKTMCGELFPFHTFHREGDEFFVLPS